MRPTLLFLAFAMTLTAQAGDSPLPPSDHDQVTSIVRRFFKALGEHDVETYRQLVLPGTQITVPPVPERKTALRRRTVEDDFEWLQKTKDELLERPTAIAVQLEGRIATVWAPYEFHRNGEFSHTGVDVFVLLKTDEGWKIASLAYSVVPVAPAK